MHMMRRLKSLTSGRASISGSGGNSRSKRSKADEDKRGEATMSAHGIKDKTTELDQQFGLARTKCDNTYESSSGSDGTIDQLPKEMHDMAIKDVKVNHHNGKANSGTVIHENGIETRQIITTTVGGQNDQPKQVLSYVAERVSGTGSFGTVFKAKCVETGEAVAIKKVLQDKRYKNRELQIMQQLDHPNVVQLRHHLFSTTEKDEVYLNLVLEYVPETVYRVMKNYREMNQHIPLIYVQLYTYQICRALAYIHNVVEVCHRDIKPQNILVLPPGVILQDGTPVDIVFNPLGVPSRMNVNPQTHQVKLCDFGSAKKLIPGEPNISYICSRYYRAPELIFGATEYTTAIDMWSAGCVFAEFLVGQPLFPGESGIDQLVAIIKILGTPTREEIKCMNPGYTEYQFPQIKAHSLQRLLSKSMPPEGVDLLSRLLQYSPKRRCTALEACAHPFFDCLRVQNLRLPNGCPPPRLFDFTPQELAGASPELIQRLVSAHMKR